MDQVFRFGFINEDDDDYENHKQDGDLEMEDVNASRTLRSKYLAEVPKLYTLQEMISSLPDQMSYVAVDINNQQGLRIPVLRRELFDIRTQLMAEDPLRDQDSIEGLSKDDITPGIYEGGFKTWECSIDLASYIASEPDLEYHIRTDPWHIIELGAGSALPTLLLFNLRQKTKTETSKSPPFHLTVADYNPSVLRLATIPNIFINHEIQHPDSNGTTNPNADHLSLEHDLSIQNIHVTAISGPWGDAFNRIVHAQAMLYEQPLRATSPHLQPQTLVLASETIYSPETLPAFVTTLLRLLTTAVQRRRRARALVAAKRFYFGVGGGVDDFIVALPQHGLVARVVWETEGEGVGRVILEVTLAG